MREKSQNYRKHSCKKHANEVNNSPEEVCDSLEPPYWSLGFHNTWTINREKWNQPQFVILASSGMFSISPKINNKARHLKLVTPATLNPKNCRFNYALSAFQSSSLGTELESNGRLTPTPHQKKKIYKNWNLETWKRPDIATVKTRQFFAGKTCCNKWPRPLTKNSRHCLWERERERASTRTIF